MNIVSLLSEQARLSPDKEIYVHYDKRGTRSSLTYKELSSCTHQLMDLFRKRGLNPGDRIMVLVPLSVNLYRILTAAFAMGLTVVLISPYLSRRQINSILNRLKPAAAVTVPLLHIAASGFTEYRRIAVKILKLPDIQLENNAPFFFPIDRGDAPALITFTSGTTGESKALVRSHGFLSIQNRVLTRVFRYSSASRELVGLPVFVLNNLASGMSAVTFHSNLLKQPDLLFQIIKKENLLRVSGSPSLIDSLCRYGQKKGLTCPKIEEIFTGGAPVPCTLLESMDRMFPRARLNIVYGSTEAQPIALADGRELLSLYRSGDFSGYCAGSTVDGIEIRTVTRLESESSNGYLHEGEIMVRGDHVINDYYQDPQSEEKHRWRDTSGQIWHRTFDTGYMDNKGRIWLTGRTTLPWKPYILEHRLQTVAGIKRVGSVSIDNKLYIFIEKEKDAVKSEILKSIEEYSSIPLNIRFLRKMPLDRRHRFRISYSILMKKYNSK